MDELQELKQKVTELISSPSGIHDELLQEVNAMLLTQYVICVKNIVIVCQRNRFGQLYVHPGYGGVDIVLSLDNTYAYSCLIKNSYISVDGEISRRFVKQYETAKFLKDAGFQIGDQQVVLKRRKHAREDIVFHTVRKGLLSIVERSDFSKEEQNQFNTRPIASLVELKDHSSSQFDFEKGYGGDWIIVQYLKKVKASNPDITAGELNELRKELYPNGSKKLLEEEFGKVQ